jgi:hypothetical protein
MLMVEQTNRLKQHPDAARPLVVKWIADRASSAAQERLLGVNNVAKEHGALHPHEGNFKAARSNKTSRPQCRPRH